MAKYSKREFQLGQYWLDQREGSPAWYRCWVEGRRTKRVSLGTPDFEQAKQALTEFFIRENTPKLEEPSAVFLADILRSYHEEHGSNVRSSSHSKVALNYWLDFWQTDTVQDVGDVKRQEEFHGFLRKKGLKDSSVLRVLTTGKAALNRAFKRGELKQVPYILTVKAAKGEPMGRPMDLAELRALYLASPLHLRVFILWMLGTAARPEAILDLTDTQVSWSDELIDLNPTGREQTKKFRPIVRLLPALARMGFEGHLIVTKSASVDSIKTAWRAARTAANLDHRVQPYSLRHTAARWMRRNGVTEWDTATQLGHRRPGTTETYTAFDPAYLKQAGKALNKLVLAVADELPVWATGAVLRNGRPVNRVGWYEQIPEGMRGAGQRLPIAAE